MTQPSWVSALVVFCVIGTTTELRAQKLFEGTITYQMTPSGGTPVEMILRSNGKKLREDMRAPGTADEANSYQIIDGESGDVMIVIPAAKQYMVNNFKRLRGANGARGDSDRARTDELLADVVATGRKETIAGITCEVYVRKSQSGNEWCLATNLGRFGVFDDQLVGSNAMSNATRPFQNGALVLRMTAGAASGHPLTMVATSVDRTPPSPSLFRVPAGFTELKNPMIPKP
jgi:hypothetical protein